MGITRISHKSKFAVPAAIVAGALIATACQAAPPIGNAQVRQPVKKTSQVFDNAAPTVVVNNGRSFLFGSTNNMRVPVREVFENTDTLAKTKAAWNSSPRDAMPTRPAWVNPSKSGIESPSVVFMGGKYVMHFAASRSGATDPNNDRCIGRAYSTRAMGPYTPDSAPVYCGLPREAGSNSWGRGAMSPDVVKAADGSYHMTVAMARTDANIASVKLDINGRVVGGVNATPATLVKSTLNWHDGTDNSSRTGSTFLNEPSMIYEPASKSYLLFYMAGGWNTTNANVGFARCASPAGPCSVDTRGPFLKSGASRTGPTGLSTYKGADGKLRVAYATWQAGKEGQAGTGGIYSRQTHFQVLSVTGGTDPAKQTVKLTN